MYCTSKGLQGELLWVSVIIPSYNRAERITKALDSVYTQTYRPIEVIVVDDGSDDNTKAVVNDWAEEKEGEDFTTRYIYQSNAGAPAARNTGIKNARGTYLQFFDSDDILLPEKLELQIALMQKKNTPLCLCDYEHVDPEGKVLLKLSNDRNHLEAIRETKGKHTSTSVIRKRILIENKIRWNTKLKRKQDQDFHTRLLMVVKDFSYVNNVLFRWNRREHSGITNDVEMSARIYLYLFRSALWFHVLRINKISVRKYPAIFSYYSLLVDKLLYRSYRFQKIKEAFKRSFITFSSYLIPKKKGLLVFESLHNKKHFSGNIKALFLYAQKYNPGRSILIGSENSFIQEARREKVEVINKKSTRRWYKLRARYLVIDSSIPLNTSYSKGNFSFVQLWHGTGFKKVLLETKRFRNERKRFQQKKKHFEKYKMIISTSKADQNKGRLAFGSEKVVITGQPRNDIFFRSPQLKTDIRKKLNAGEFSQLITYVPTYRDHKTTTPFTQIFWSKLNSYLKEKNALFVVKKHPLDRFFSLPKEYSNIQDWTSRLSDLQNLLLISDVLISDYSSIITDFALTNRPILLYMYDKEAYEENCRASHYNLEEILPGPFIFKEDDLINRLKDLSWTQTPEYQKKYKEFKDKFHKYQDGNSSKRVLEAIRKL